MSPKHPKPIAARALARALVVAVALALPASAAAVPQGGSTLPAVTLSDAWDRTLDLGKLAGKPTLVVYEDKDSAQQNAALKEELSKLAKGDKYKERVALVAVADVSGFDYWPAKGFVKDAIKSESRKAGTVIYCDWSGAARDRLAVKKGVSSVVLYDKSGKVAFSASGTLSAAQRKELVGLVRAELGE